MTRSVRSRFAAGMISLSLFLITFQAGAADITGDIVHIEAKSSYHWISVFDRGVLWCAPSQLYSPLSDSLFLYEFSTKSVRRIAQTQDGWQIMPAHGSGNRIAWLEYRDGEPPVRWTLKERHLEEDYATTISSGSAWPNSMPTFALSGDMIAFSKPSGVAPGAVHTLTVIDLVQKSSIVELAEGESSFSSPVLNSSILICCRGDGPERSDLYLVDLASGRRESLTTDGTSHQPSLDGERLVWKKASNLFSYGQILLAHLIGRKLTDVRTLSERGDMPTVSKGFITWHSDSYESIVAITHEGPRIVDQGEGSFGKPWTSENSLAWGWVNPPATRFEIRAISP